MRAITVFKNTIKRTPLAWLYISCKRIFHQPASQSDEADIIERLVRECNAPKTFIEFGFSGWELNCARLALNSQWNGLLADGGAWNVTIARQLFHDKIIARQMWITLETLDVMLEYARHNDVGVLSVDVDGNDYWFLEKLIPLRPVIIVAEFNVSLGSRPITVPYDPAFDRTTAHKSCEYYGASLAALHHLCAEHGYSLIDVSRNGVNAFFVRNDLLAPDTRTLAPDEAYGVKRYPDGSVAPTGQFWEEIKHLDYVDVTKPEPRSAFDSTRRVCEEITEHAERPRA